MAASQLCRPTVHWSLSWSDPIESPSEWTRADYSKLKALISVIIERFQRRILFVRLQAPLATDTLRVYFIEHAEVFKTVCVELFL
jgi:hypothetical protein